MTFSFSIIREALSILTGATIFLICIALVARELPFSPLFSHHGNDVRFVHRLLEENKKRIVESRRYLRDYAAGLAKWPTHSHYDLVVVIITMNTLPQTRGSEPITRRIFLPQTLAAALREVESDAHTAFEASTVTLCNVNVPPESNGQATRYSNFVKTFTRNSTASYENVYDKEKDDYRFCLEQASLHFKFKYVLVLEDDAVMRPGSASTLSYFIESLRHRHTEPAWVSIKLYHPKKWLGYSRETYSIVELTATASVLGSLIHVAFGSCRSRCRNQPSVLHLAFFISLSLVVCLMLGRQNVFRWRGISRFSHSLTEAQGCCTQAVLYDGTSIPALLRYLSKVRCSYSMPVDLALDEFADLYGWRRYMLEPNVCEHVGFLSTFDKDSHKAIDFL